MSVKRLFRFAILFAGINWLMSCKTSKQLAYFQDLNDTSKIQTAVQYPYEPLTLKVDDQVQITISSTAPEAAQYFNLVAGTTTSVYTVSPNGNITLPVLGDIQVLDLTTQELKLKIADALKAYLKDAVVGVMLINFKVTVIGEVGHPVTVNVKGERLDVLEAIGAAGDMTAFSNRYNVKVMRKAPGGIQIAHLNFNNSKMLQSPFYQLRQNDVVYVEPNKDKGFKNERFAIIMPFIVSVTSFIITFVTLYFRFK